MMKNDSFIAINADIFISGLTEDVGDDSERVGKFVTVQNLLRSRCS
jgi:hypothetical protein